MTRLGEAAAKNGITLERAIIAIAVALASAPGFIGTNKADDWGSYNWRLIQDMRDRIVALEVEVKNLKERRP
jgi:hypothetical protein